MMEVVCKMKGLRPGAPLPSFLSQRTAVKMGVFGRQRLFFFLQECIYKYMCICVYVCICLIFLTVFRYTQHTLNSSTGTTPAIFGVVWYNDICVEFVCPLFLSRGAPSGWLLGPQPKKVGEAGKKRDDWWDPSRTLLTNAADLQNFMLTYDKDNIPESLINKIRPYIDDERCVLPPPPPNGRVGYCEDTCG